MSEKLVFKSSSEESPPQEVGFDKKQEAVEARLNHEGEMLKTFQKKAETLAPDKRRSVFKKIAAFGMTSFMAANIGFAAMPQKTEAGGRHRESSGTRITEAVAAVFLGAIDRDLREQTRMRREREREWERERERAERARERAEERWERGRERAEERMQREQERSATEDQRQAERERREDEHRARGEGQRVSQREEQERIAAIKEEKERVEAIKKLSPKVKAELGKMQAKDDYRPGAKLVIKGDPDKVWLDNYVTEWIRLDRQEKAKQ